MLDRVSKWTYRHRRSATIAFSVLILVCIASLFTVALFVDKQHELRLAIESKHTEEKRARENFRRTREVLDQFGLLVAENLRDVPGAAPLRKQMVRDLLEYYEEFVVNAEETPELREELARTHFRAARIIEEMGGLKQALKTYQRARELYTVLVAEEDSRADSRLQLALCENNIGLLNAELGTPNAAERHYKSAIKQLESIDRPASVARRELAGVFGNLGLLRSADEDFEGASQAFQTALELLTENADSCREDLQWQLATAMTLNNLGYLYQQSDPTVALEFNDRAIVVLRKQARFSGTSSIVQPLATSLNNQASLLASQKQWDLSLSSYREAIALYQTLVDESHSWRCTEELAICYNNLGRLLTRLERLGDAGVALAEAQTILTKLCERAPDQARYRLSLGGVLNNLARVAMLRGNFDQAIGLYQRSLVEQDRLPASSGTSSLQQAMLATTYANYESALRRTGRVEEAEQVRAMQQQ